MKGYQVLAHKIVLNFINAFEIYKNKATTYGALGRLEKQGLIIKVRNNLYVSINPATGYAFATKYQIGPSVNKDTFISHISALEYYGYQNQVGYVCCVSSSSRFNAFEYEGIIYKHISIKSNKGIISPSYTVLIKITDVEKTVVDSIQTIGSIISLEELIYSLEIITKLDEKKLIEYLEDYNIQALYQKTGYLLSLFNDTFQLSEFFFESIKKEFLKVLRIYLMMPNKMVYSSKHIKLLCQNG